MILNAYFPDACPFPLVAVVAPKVRHVGALTLPYAS